ncbi:hypothetical protein CVT26_010611 [Gymnopilus dilepis]|uniref:Beta/gamma crystallin 'Greek key' domain-containing protein n=1 Tax=Gymnopilus dilepis TaxID=231916 RepID=A0A409W562_9AGAR|nr:hypothetical protein CVT26_010611 [Gymnopilus dilepis]
MFKLVLAALAVAATASAKCAYSTEGHGFEMYIYGETNCGTGNHWEEFYGAGDSLACDCFNVASALNDKVKSFVFTASTRHSVNIYEDANCKGAVLGSSVGNWIDSSVSTNGQKMSSFNVCLY